MTPKNPLKFGPVSINAGVILALFSFFVPLTVCAQTVDMSKMPKLKPGLWAKKIRSGPTERDTAEFLLCVGKNNRRLSYDLTHHENVKRACHVTEIRAEKKKASFRYVCHYIDMAQISAETVFEGDFSAAYTGRENVTESDHCRFRALEKGHELSCQTREFTRIHEARRLGPCAPGQKPGLIPPARESKIQGK